MLFLLRQLSYAVNCQRNGKYDADDRDQRHAGCRLGLQIDACENAGADEEHAGDE